MPPEPLFSVVMPVWNRAALLPESIESVRAQSEARLELIVVDDGSTDGSAAVAERIAGEDGRIRVLRGPNGGPGAARNRGVAAARAAWIAYLDSDDLWYPDALARCRATIDANPDVDIVYGRRDRLVGGRIARAPAPRDERVMGPRELFQGIVLHLLSTAHTRALFDAAGGFDPALPVCEDWDLLLRMSRIARMAPVGASLGAKRRHAGNLTRAEARGRVVEALVARRFLAAGGEALVPREEADRRLAHLEYAAARALLREGDAPGALAALERGRPHGLAWRARALGLAARIAAALRGAAP